MHEQASAASFPASALPALADLRRDPFLRVAIVGERAWLRWQKNDPSLAHRLMAMTGAVLYSRGDDGAWRPIGQRLPSFDHPLDSAEFTTLVHAITPLPLDPIAPPESAPEPARLRLVRDACPRPATAFLCGVDDLAAWADRAPSVDVGALSAVVCEGLALVRGRPNMLPTIAGSDRFWGDRLLVPLGWRPDPDLDEKALLHALLVSADDLILVHASGACETIGRDGFARLSLASIRLAAKGEGAASP